MLTLTNLTDNMKWHQCSLDPVQKKLHKLHDRNLFVVDVSNEVIARYQSCLRRLKAVKKKKNIMLMNTQNTLQDIEGSRVEAMVKPSAATRTMLFRIFHTKWHLHPNQFMIPHQKQRIWLFAGLGSKVPNSMRPPMALPCFANAMEPDGRQADCAEWKAASNIHLSSIMPAWTVTNLVKLQAKKLGIAVSTLSRLNPWDSFGPLHQPTYSKQSKC